jgi:hypothetical protein
MKKGRCGTLTHDDNRHGTTVWTKTTQEILVKLNRARISLDKTRRT